MCLFYRLAKRKQRCAFVLQDGQRKMETHVCFTCWLKESGELFYRLSKGKWRQVCLFYRLSQGKWRQMCLFYGLSKGKWRQVCLFYRLSKRKWRHVLVLQKLSKGKWRHVCLFYRLSKGKWRQVYLFYRVAQEEYTRLKGPGDNSVLWNAMVNPLLKLTIYGAIWYQGELTSLSLSHIFLVQF